MSYPINNLSHDDLLIISNALNEICNGVHLQEWDFQTRMGVDRSEARALLARVNDALGQTVTEQ